MSVTVVSRDQQIKKTTGYAWVANASDGTMSDFSITASSAVATDANGSPVASSTTATELGYVHGVTSSIQTQLNGKLSLTGGTMSGAINMGNNQINSLATPTLSTDAATKGYVDSLSQGLSWKNAALVATTAPLTQAYTQSSPTVLTENSATDGVLQNIDGHTPQVNDRILIKNEISGNAPNNGIYIVTATGDGATIPWVLTRSSDMNTWTDVPAAAVFVQEGSVNADIAFVCTSQPGGTLGTTAITFVQFASSTGYTSGNGISISGFVISADVDNSTIDFTGTHLEVKAGGITNTQVSASAAISYSKLNLSNSIVNGDINSSAAIAYSKLNLSNSIVNADINTAAAISYSKLNLTGSIVNGDISASAAIAFSKLASLPSADILVGNGSNVATAVAMSGDVHIDNTGSTTIQPGVVTGSKIASNTITESNIVAGTITNTSISASAAIAFSKLASLTSANILVGNGSNVATSVSMTGDVSITNTGVTSISSGIGNHLVTRETPSGTINGSNPTFTLAHTPNPVGSEMLFVNGLLQNAGVSNDYTISGVTITFNAGAIPEGGSTLLATYWF